MPDLLPSRPGLHPAEALDGYLERLAEANGLSTATLHKLMLEALGADTTALAFLMVSPSVPPSKRSPTWWGRPRRA